MTEGEEKVRGSPALLRNPAVRQPLTMHYVAPMMARTAGCGIRAPLRKIAAVAVAR